MIIRSVMTLFTILSLHSISFSQFTFSYQGANLCNSSITAISNTATTMTFTASGTKPAPGTYYIVMQYYHPVTGNLSGFPRKSATITTTSTSFTITFSTSTLPPTLISADVPLLIDIDQQSSVTPFEYYLYYPNGTSFTSSCAIVLPLTFVSFTTSSVGSYNKLQWVTASESNTSYFRIQRSTDAVNYVNHGIEPAAGSSSTNLTYTFYTPRANAGTRYYYRVTCVDLDGTQTTPPVVWADGVGTGNPTDFCSYTNIEGPLAFCTGVTSAQYKLHNAPWGAITWSASPSNVNVVSGPAGGGSIAQVTKTGSGSTTTLSVSAGGCTKTKTVSIVPPTVSIQITYYVDNPTHTTYYVYASPNPASSGTNFRWYKNGVYYGTFMSDTIAVTSSEGSSNWSVVASTACGDVTGSTTLYYHSGFFGLRYVLSPVPANNLLTISPNPDYIASKAKEKESMVDEKCLIQIVDMFGNLKREIKNVSLRNSYQIDVSSLLSGNYIIHVINGKDRFSSQVRITK